MGEDEGECREKARKGGITHGEVGRIPLNGRGDFNLTGDLEMLRRRERKAVGLR